MASKAKKAAKSSPAEEETVVYDFLSKVRCNVLDFHHSREKGVIHGRQ